MVGVAFVAFSHQQEDLLKLTPTPMPTPLLPTPMPTPMTHLPMTTSTTTQTTKK